MKTKQPGLPDLGCVAGGGRAFVQLRFTGSSPVPVLIAVLRSLRTVIH